MLNTHPSLQRDARHGRAPALRARPIAAGRGDASCSAPGAASSFGARSDPELPPSCPWQRSGAIPAPGAVSWPRAKPSATGEGQSRSLGAPTFWAGERRPRTLTSCFRAKLLGAPQGEGRAMRSVPRGARSPLLAARTWLRSPSCCSPAPSHSQLPTSVQPPGGRAGPPRPPLTREAPGASGPAPAPQPARGCGSAQAAAAL